MKPKKKQNNCNDKLLLKLVSIVVLNSICIMLGGNFLKIQYIFLIIHFIILIKVNPRQLLPVILFTHTCSGLYDSIGFSYLFNFTILFFLIKLLVVNKAINKSMIPIVIIFLFDFLMMFFNPQATLTNYISTISLLVSYIFSNLLSDSKFEIDLDILFKYFFIGFIVSGLCAISLPISIWGMDIPTAYRFKGFLRDPNYYAIDAILLLGMSFILKKKFINFIIIFVVGILSISKMFLLLSILLLLLNILYYLLKKNSKYFVYVLLFIMISPFVFKFITTTKLYETIINKYLYRTEVSSLFTGRDYLQSYYINKLFTSPSVLIFGRGTLYRLVLGVGGDTRYVNYAAHNTYLDILLSWGILGTIIFLNYLGLLKNNVKKIKIISNSTDLQKGSYYILCFIMMAALFALSYLSVDFFAILIVLLLILNPKNVKNDEMEEKK